MQHCTERMVRAQTEMKERMKRGYCLLIYLHTADAHVDENTQHWKHNIFVVSDQQREDHILAPDFRVVKDYRRIASETFKEWWSHRLRVCNSLWEKTLKTALAIESEGHSLTHNAESTKAFNGANQTLELTRHERAVLSFTKFTENLFHNKLVWPAE